MTHLTTLPKDTKVTSLLDADSIAYKVACVQRSDDLDQDEVEILLRRLINEWSKWGDDKVVCLSLGRSFRYEVLPTYKHNRKDKEKPPALSHCLDFLRETYPVQEKDGWEGDDVLGVLATCGKYECPLMVSIDKDMRQVPGWHWNPDKDRWPVYVREDEAQYHYYTQWLTGDSTDGYAGIPRTGPAKAAKILSQPTCMVDTWIAEVSGAYEQAKLDKDYMEQQGKVAKILTTNRG
jgi:DNA polymerase-1